MLSRAKKPATKSVWNLSTHPNFTPAYEQKTRDFDTDDRMNVSRYEY